MNSYRAPFFGTLAVLVILIVAGVGYLIGHTAATPEAQAAQARNDARQLAYDAANARSAASSRTRGRADGIADGRKAGAAAGKKAGQAARRKKAAKAKMLTAKPSTPVPSATPGSGSLSTAIAKVASLGYTASDTSTYQPGNALHVLIGIRTGSADGYGRQAFFFAGDKYLGTDTSDPSAAMSVAWQDSSMVAIDYSLYNTDDAYCCPTGSATVRYQWNGSRLVPLDPIPTSENTDGSRL